MVSILDYQFNEAAIGTNSLPFPLTTGQEVAIATIFLTSFSGSDRLLFGGTVGFQPDLLLLTPVLPVFIVRIRRGGPAPNAPVIFETRDSSFLGTGGLVPIVSDPITTSFHHSEFSPAIGTQQYFLTVELAGLGSATLFGPVHLHGMVLSP